MIVLKRRLTLCEVAGSDNVGKFARITRGHKSSTNCECCRWNLGRLILCTESLRFSLPSAVLMIAIAYGFQAINAHQDFYTA
jgi:hypothetical protein